MRSLVVVERTCTFDPDETPQTSYYPSNLSANQGCARSFAGLIRGHWGGCENRNHWVRDHCFREDNTRLRGYDANCTLAAVRVCLIANKSLLHPEHSWLEIKDRSQCYPQAPLDAILKLSPK